MLTVFYRNPRLLILTIGLIVVAGLSSFTIMPRMEDPLLTPRAATITTLLPGADAERVEALVTEKIEAELKEIEEIKQVRSSSRTGVSFIAIELRDEVNEAEALNVWARTRDKAADAALLLPPGATKPEFERLDAKAFALIVGLRWDRDDEPNFAILRRLLKQLKDEIDSVSGTEKSSIFGDPSEEILVTVRPEAAASLDLNAADLARQILASDSKVSAGQLRSDSSEVLLEVSGELDTITRVSHIPIRFGGSSNFVELADIADIEKSIKSPPSAQVVLRDQPSIVLGVLVRAETRLDLWASEVNAIIERYQADLPPGVAFETVFEQSPFVKSRINTLMLNLLFGGLAVTLTVLLFMGWRSAFIVGSALPLGCLMVLTAMHWMKIPIHQMSVTGLIIALGLMIDNAIVTIDDVWHRLKEGKRPGQAIRECTQFLAVPLAGSTLTTVLSFGPIALMPGPAGEFVGSIAVVTILAIVSTLILSLTVVSALACFGLRPGDVNKSLLAVGLSSDRLARGYKSLLIVLFKRPRLTAIGCMVLPIAGLIGVVQLPEQFFPPADRSQFQIELELPVTSSIAETEQTAAKIRRLLLEEDAVSKVAWFLGESAPTFYYNVIPERKNAPRYGQAIVDCKAGTDTRALIHKVQSILDQAFPHATCLVRQLEQGPPFSAPIEIRLFGPDTEVLHELGEQVRYVMTQTPHIIQTRSELSEALPKITFAVNEQQAKLAGLNHLTIADELNSSLEGTTGGSILEATEELPVRVRFSSDRRSDLNKIASMDLLAAPSMQAKPTQDNTYRGIPLSAISSITLASDVSGVNRLDGKRMNEVQAFITAGKLPSQVLNDLEMRLEEAGFKLPPGYTRSSGGAEAERNDAVGNLLANASILFTMMVATLVLIFGSFRLSLVIWTVALLSTGFGLGSLWIAGFPWGFMSIVGIMGMIGIAINDSIVVLTALQSLPPAKAQRFLAVCDVVIVNTRHVLATTFSTIVGFTPLILGGGEFWPPVAVSIAGGVCGATFLALVFVPSVFLLIKQHDAKKAVMAANQPSFSMST
jgi:multidrug efflux pump subunit AcrB